MSNYKYFGQNVIMFQFGFNLTVLSYLSIYKAKDDSHKDALKYKYTKYKVISRTLYHMLYLFEITSYRHRQL